MRAILALALLLPGASAGCRATGAETLLLAPSAEASATLGAPVPRARMTGSAGALTGRIAGGEARLRDVAVPVPADATMSAPGDAAIPYRAVGDGRFELTRAVRFETTRFGPVVLTPGYRSDGSSSPITDVEGSRLAGFLHDALYAASGHLRFPHGAPARWTKAEADDAYCAEMARRGVPAWHARANCAGVRGLPHIGAAWQRLAPKRERRWAQWAERPPDR